jgi:hypothetical protein
MILLSTTLLREETKLHSQVEEKLSICTQVEREITILHCEGELIVVLIGVK